ncbi:cystatin-B-like [Liolophura sinensis]|uniref:cystatin-B-like n=1 Tax=Liolophura sinensis TaxID=3198878 RepID=UPI003158B431
MMCGGATEMKVATDDIKELVEKVRPQAVRKSEGRNFSEFTATHYKSQVVAGTNFFIKVSLGGDNYAHLRVFRPLPGAGEEELVAIQFDKKPEDPIEYF